MHLDRCNGVGEAAPAQAIQSCTYVVRARNATDAARAVAFNNRGHYYLQLNDQDRALADFSQAVRANSQFAPAHLSRGEIYVARGQFARAVVDYSDAIALTPGDPSGYNARCWARVLWNASLDLARADCDAALRLKPEDPSALDSRGLLNLREGRFQDAWNDYDAALLTHPEEAHFLYGRGLAALRLGRTQEGQADLAAAAQRDARVAEIYAGYGVAP
jgi:tetratricopeptide (TPR) repeat protein